MLREQRYIFAAAAPELLHTFYPILTGYILEVQLRDDTEPSGMHFNLQGFSLFLLNGNRK